jgi:hypothetical protein
MLHRLNTTPELLVACPEPGKWQRYNLKQLMGENLQIIHILRSRAFSLFHQRTPIQSTRVSVR